MTSNVCLLKAPNQHDLKNTVSSSINLLGYKFDKSIKTIIIKPNLCYYWSSASGYTTDVRVVEAIIDVVREQCSQDVNIKIAEADATAMKTRHAFPMLGYTQLAEKKQVELFNLCEGEKVKKDVTVNGINLSFEVSNLLLEADLFINVPKLKTMPEVAITCAYKNLFGAMAHVRKADYHVHLNESIVAINKILKPHLTIVDGLFALCHRPMKLDLILAGTDTFAVDWVAAQLLGYDPSKVKFLSVARKENMGNPADLKVSGLTIEEVIRTIPNKNSFADQFLKSAEKNVLKMYSKIIGESA